MHGIICMWSGVIADIPDGWWICDGTHGTPDLQNRFVRPASADFSPHQKGGTYKHLHEINLFTTEHGHTGSADQDAHTHVSAAASNTDNLAAGNELLSSYPDGDIQTTTVGHDHDVTVQSDSHGHDLTIQSNVHGHDVECVEAWNLPVYYTLCFIMKL